MSSYAKPPIQLALLGKAAFAIGFLPLNPCERVLGVIQPYLRRRQSARAYNTMAGTVELPELNGVVRRGAIANSASCRDRFQGEAGCFHETSEKIPVAPSNAR